MDTLKIEHNNFIGAKRSSDSSHNSVKGTTQYIPEDYLTLAKEMDASFQKHLYEEMDKTIKPSQDPSPEENFYKDRLREEIAKVSVEKNKGLGLQKLILDQIYPEKYRNKQNFDYQVEAKKKRNQKQINSFQKINSSDTNSHIIKKSDSPKQVIQSTNELQEVPVSNVSNFSSKSKIPELRFFKG